MRKSITKEQIKCIKTIQRRHQDDDEYREMLQGRFNVESCLQLSSAQAGALIELYIKWGWADSMRSKFQNPKKNTKPEIITPRQSGNMTKMVSPAQKKKIGMLADMIEWRVKDGLTRWISARFSTNQIKTAQQAWQVIEGLKKMFERQMNKQYGAGWKNLDYDDISIRKYLEIHERKNKK